MIKRLLLFIVLLVVVVFIFRSKVTGTVIKWDTQEIRQGLPSIPAFSPSDESACEQALEERKVACDAYVESFPNGCMWWHVAWISDCHEKRMACFEKHDVAIDVCS